MEMLFVLNEEINKYDNIYIYGSGEFSVDLMTYMLQLDISIKGFIFDGVVETRSRIYNKPIFELSSIKTDKNIVVIIPAIYNYEEYRIIKEQGIEKVYFSELYKKIFVKRINNTAPKAFTLNQKFINKNQKIVYGAGKSGKKYARILYQNDIVIDAFADSNQAKQGTKTDGIPIISKGEICKYGQEVGIVIPPAFTADIYNNFEREQQKECFLPPSKYGLYFEKKDGIEELLDIGVIQKIIDQSIDKKVMIYGSNSSAINLRNVLNKLQIKVDCFIDNSCNRNEEIIIQNIDNLLYENLNEVLIVIPDIDRETLESKISNLEKIDGKIEYISIGDSAGRTCQYIDPDLGYNVLMDKMGFKIYRRIIDEQKKLYRIVTLGNSTTYAEYKWTIKSWSELLFEKIKLSTNINIEVICGGMNSYNSHDELIKLIRDGIILRPDMVLSYSGVNDMGFIEGVEEYPHLRGSRKEQFMKVCQLYSSKDRNKVQNTISCGLKNTKKDYEYWLDNIRMMHAICKEFAIDFYAFLQPTVLGKDYILSKVEEYIFQEEFAEDRANEILKYADAFYKNAIENIKDYDYIKDFTNIFSKQSGVFFDSVHLNTIGNKVVAEKIYDVISTKILK